MHNPGMTRMTTFGAVLLLSCTLVSAAPPLRLAVPGGAQGLDAARLWTAIAHEFRSPDGTSLQPVIIQDGTTALDLLQQRQVELAVLDPLHLLHRDEELEVLGIVELYGKPVEAFLLIASMDSIIHRVEDLWRARLMLAGPHNSLSWAYPLYWVKSSIGFQGGMPLPFEADSYSGLLRGIALGTADAGFIPEGFFLSMSDRVLASRVRVIDRTEAFPLQLLVRRMDMGSDRRLVSERLPGLAIEGLRISAPDSQLDRVLAHLFDIMARQESLGVPQP